MHQSRYSIVLPMLYLVHLVSIVNLLLQHLVFAVTIVSGIIMFLLFASEFGYYLTTEVWPTVVVMSLLKCVTT